MKADQSLVEHALQNSCAQTEVTQVDQGRDRPTKREETPNGVCRVAAADLYDGI